MASNTCYIIFKKKADTDPKTIVESRVATSSYWIDWATSAYISWASGKARLFRYKFDTTSYKKAWYKTTTFPDSAKFYRIAKTPTGFSDDYSANVELLNAEWEQISYNELPNGFLSDVHSDTASSDDSDYYETGFTVTGITGNEYDYAILLLYPTVVSRDTLVSFTQNLTNCSSNISDTAIGRKTTVNLIVTPNSGYHFDETPTLSNGATFTPLNDGYTADVQFLTDVTLTANAVSDGGKTKYTFTQNLTNCTTNISDSEIEENTSVNLVVTPNSGYHFDETPTLSNGATFTEDDGIYTATFTMNENVVLTAAAVTDVTKYTFTQNLTNCTTNISDSEIEENTSVNLVVTPNSGYHFDETPTLSNGATFTEDDGIYTATFTMNENVVLTAAAVIKPTEYEIKTNVSNVEYIILDKDGNDITSRGYWNSDLIPLTFKTKANNGYYFETIPTVAYFNNIHIQIKTSLTLDEASGYYTATISPYEQYVSFTANAAVETTVNNKYGVITIYNLQTDDLKEIAKARYFYETKGQYEEQFYKDLGDFISKLHVMYVSFNDLRTQRLYLGNYPVTTALYPVIDDNVIILDCGTITINETYNNVVDYNATIKIMLPFIGFKTLNTVDVMGKTLHLYYKADVITGNAKAYLTFVNGKSEIVIDIYDCTMSYNIPFVSLTDIEKTYNLNTNFLYGFDAYVIIDTPRVIGDNYTYGNNTNVVDSIGNFSGYCSFSDITLTTTATETEQNEIIKLLESGVIL